MAKRTFVKQVKENEMNKRKALARFEEELDYQKEVLKKAFGVPNDLSIEGAIEYVFDLGTDLAYSHEIHSTIRMWARTVIALKQPHNKGKVYDFSAYQEKIENMDVTKLMNSVLVYNFDLPNKKEFKDIKNSFKAELKRREEEMDILIALRCGVRSWV
jgi:hypothetical protein